MAPCSFCPLPSVGNYALTRQSGDSWQRASIGVAVVAPSAGFAAERMDEVERFLWSRADIEITSADRHWMEIER